MAKRKAVQRVKQVHRKKINWVDDDAPAAENSMPNGEAEEPETVEHQPENAGEDSPTELAERDDISAAEDNEGLLPSTSEEAVGSEKLEHNDNDDEFIVVNKDEAPMELAEEYPSVQVFSTFLHPDNRPPKKFHQ